VLAFCFGATGQSINTSPGAGCELPKLFVIPPKDALAGKEAEIQAAAKTYFDGIGAYSACIQAELAAAGGDAAPELVRQILIRRNNALVEEADLMMKRFTVTFGVAAPSTPVALPVAVPAAR
jgi:hypothetical protein